MSVFDNLGEERADEIYKGFIESGFSDDDAFSETYSIECRLDNNECDEKLIPIQIFEAKNKKVKMSEFEDLFNSQEKCDTYCEYIGRDNDALYWRCDGGGYIIRNSIDHDKIGNEHACATIELYDMIGSDGYPDDKHTYEFGIYITTPDGRYDAGRYDNIRMATNIYDAVCDNLSSFYME